MKGKGFLLLYAASIPCLQSLLPIKGTCSENSAGKQISVLDFACYGVVGYSYYVPDGLTPSDLNEYAATEILRISDYPLPMDCQTLYKKAVCEIVYRPCPTQMTNFVPSDVPLPTLESKYMMPFGQLCLSSCQKSFAQCGLNIWQTGSQLNCSAGHDYTHNHYITYKPFKSLFHQLHQSNSGTLVTGGSIVAPYLFLSVYGNQVSHTKEQLSDLALNLSTQNFSNIATTNANDTGPMGWPVMCPEGFVVPDNPMDPRVIWIPYTGCALACRLPGLTTQSEIESLNLMVIIGPAIGFPLISFVAITWMTDRIRLKKQYLIFIFICLSAMFTSTFLMIAISGTQEKKFCHDNATEINQSDGITACAVQAGMIIYSFMAFSFCWAIQAIELFCKIVLKRKAKKRTYIHLFIIFVLPAGALAYGVSYRSLGYNRVLPICFISYSSDAGPNNLPHDLLFFYIPILFSSTLGTASMVAVLIRIIISFTCSKNNTKEHAKIAPSEVHTAVTMAALIGGSRSAEDRHPELMSALSTPVLLSSIPTEASCGVFSNAFSFAAESQSVSEGLRGSSGISTKEIIQNEKSAAQNGTKSSRKKAFKLSSMFFTIRKRFKLLRTSLYFLVFYLLLWISVVRYRLDFLVRKDQVAENFQLWVICIFTNYRGDDSVWKAVCGLKPKGNVSATGYVWIVGVMAGHSLLFAYIFFPALKGSYEHFDKSFRRKYRAFMKRACVKKAVSYMQCYWCNTKNERGQGDVLVGQKGVNSIKVLSVPYLKPETFKNLTVPSTNSNNMINTNTFQGCSINVSDNTKSYDQNKSHVKVADQTDLTVTADRLKVSAYVSSIGGILLKASSFSSRGTAVSRNIPSFNGLKNVGDLDDDTFLRQQSHTSENSENFIGDKSVSNRFHEFDINKSKGNQSDVVRNVMQLNIKGEKSDNNVHKDLRENVVDDDKNLHISSNKNNKSNNSGSNSNNINVNNGSNNKSIDVSNNSSSNGNYNNDNNINRSESSNNNLISSSYAILRTYSDNNNNDANSHTVEGSNLCATTPISTLNPISNPNPNSIFNSSYLDIATVLQKTMKTNNSTTSDEQKGSSQGNSRKKFSSPSSFTSFSLDSQQVKSDEIEAIKELKKDVSFSDNILSNIIPCRPVDALRKKSPKQLLSEKTLTTNLDTSTGGELSYTRDRLGSNYDSKAVNVELNDLSVHYSL